MRVLVFIIVLLNFFGCSSCSSKSSANGEGGVDTTTGSTTNSNTNTESDTETVTETNTVTSDDPCEGPLNLNWQPLPLGIDCGLGCTQLTFEEINSLTGWSAGEKYLAATTDPEGRLIIVRLEDKQFAKIEPEWINNVRRKFSGVSVSGSLLVADFDIWDTIVEKKLCVFDFETNKINSWLKQTEDTESLTGYFDLALFDNTVAFLHSGIGFSGEKAVKYLNVLNGSETEVNLSWERRFNADMSTDIIVWSEGIDDTRGDIWAHRISTKETLNVSDHPAQQFFPRIDGNRVVWTDDRNGSGNYENADIYMYDFSTQQTTRVTNGAWIQTEPDISGDRVVFEDYRAAQNPNNIYELNSMNVWMVDLSTGDEHQITSFEGSEGDPQIVGDKVFYYRQVPGETYFGIFMQELSALKLK